MQIYIIFSIIYLNEISNNTKKVGIKSYIFSPFSPRRRAKPKRHSPDPWILRVRDWQVPALSWVPDDAVACMLHPVVDLLQRCLRVIHTKSASEPRRRVSAVVFFKLSQFHVLKDLGHSGRSRKRRPRLNETELCELKRHCSCE